MSVFGLAGTQMATSEFVASIKSLRKRIDKLAAIHAAGQKTAPETDLRDVTAALKLYDLLLKNPEGYKVDRVRKALAELPISLAAIPVLGDNRIAIHLGISYTFKDYSNIVPKDVADKFRVTPVMVFRDGKDSPWLDRVVSKMKGVSMDGVSFKNGVYTKCVGVTAVWGGTNVPCPNDDQVRVLDQPRHRCDDCTKAFTKIRTKMRRTGKVSDVSSSTMLDELMSLLD